MYLEISPEFLSGNWKYWSGLRALTTDSLCVCVCVCVFAFTGTGSSGYEQLFVLNLFLPEDGMFLVHSNGWNVFVLTSEWNVFCPHQWME
jgi:hypothetical protein